MTHEIKFKNQPNPIPDWSLKVTEKNWHYFTYIKRSTANR